MSDASQAEVKAREFIEEYGDMVEDAGPLAIRMIAKEGMIVSVELRDEVKQAGDSLSHAFRRATNLHSTGAPAKQVAAVEARIPRLRETYQRKHELAMELGDLTDRAAELAEGGAGVDPFPDHPLGTAPLDPKQWFDRPFDDEERKVARPWWRRMFS